MKSAHQLLTHYDRRENLEEWRRLAGQSEEYEAKNMTLKGFRNMIHGRRLSSDEQSDSLL